jgi:hypothetical protein
MPKAIAKNLTFLAPRKPRVARTIRNTQLSDQLKNYNQKGTK